MRKIESDLLRAYESGGKVYADVTLALKDLKSLSMLAALAGADRLAAKLDAAAREAEEGLDGLIN